MKKITSALLLASMMIASSPLAYSNDNDYWDRQEAAAKIKQENKIKTDAQAAIHLQEQLANGRCYTGADKNLEEIYDQSSNLKEMYKFQTKKEFDDQSLAGTNGFPVITGMTVGSWVCMAGVAFSLANPAVIVPCGAVILGGGIVGGIVKNQTQKVASDQAARSAEDADSVAQGDALMKAIHLNEFEKQAGQAVAALFVQDAVCPANGMNDRECSERYGMYPGEQMINALTFVRNAISYYPQALTRFAKVNKSELQKAKLQYLEKLHGCSDEKQVPQFGELLKIILENKGYAVSGELPASKNRATSVQPVVQETNRALRNDDKYDDRCEDSSSKECNSFQAR